MTYYRDRQQNNSSTIKGKQNLKIYISFPNRYALWIHSMHPDFGTKLPKFQNNPTHPQFNQNSQNSTQVYIYMSPTPKIILQALKQTSTPPHQFLYPRPKHTHSKKRSKAGNNVRSHHNQVSIMLYFKIQVQYGVKSNFSSFSLEYIHEVVIHSLR